MGRKEPNYSKLKIRWCVQFRRTNTGMGSEYQQKLFSDEQDAAAFFEQIRNVRFNVDIKLLRVVEVQVAETVRTAKLSTPIIEGQ